MRIALVGAEFEDNLAVRYLRGALEREGHQVVQVVFNDAVDLEAAAEHIVDEAADITGFSMVFTWRAQEFAQLATRARELGYAGHAVAGGHFATFHAAQLLADVPAFDSVACGEGEEILCSLAESLADPSRVPGLVWRRDGGLVTNPASVKPLDLDALAPPPRRKPFARFLGLPITNIIGSRGCLHACSFCSIVAWHKAVGGMALRLRDPARVADEMADLYRQGVRIFNFHDDNFFLARAEDTYARMRALRAALDAQGVGRIAFAAKCRPDCVDEGLLTYMKSIGLFRLFLGIEAGTAEALKRLGRGQTPDQNVFALEVVNRLDLHTCFNLLILNPDSTLEDFAANVRFLAAHPSNPMNFCRTEVYSGTPLEKKLRLQHRLLGDYWGYDYVIADPRAQSLFEVVFPAFEQRNFGIDGLHHLAMSVDYEHQLLGHFFGVRDALRRRVKDFVVAVNQNTCAHLRDAADTVSRGFGTERAREVYATALRARVEYDNARLTAAGADLLEEIRRVGREARFPPRPVARHAAVVGLAALTFATTACRDDATSAQPPAPSAPERGAQSPPDGGPLVLRPPMPSPPAPPDAGARPVSIDAGVAASPDAASPSPPPFTHMYEMAARPPRPVPPVGSPRPPGTAPDAGRRVRPRPPVHIEYSEMAPKPTRGRKR